MRRRTGWYFLEKNDIQEDLDGNIKFEGRLVVFSTIKTDCHDITEILSESGVTHHNPHPFNINYIELKPLNNGQWFKINVCTW